MNLERCLEIIKVDDLKVPYMLGIDWDITDDLNYWYKKGTNNILLVAHIDTIPRINNVKRFKKKSKPLELLNVNGIIQAKDSVLGADDRAGCYAIDQLYNKYGTQCSILLTNFEETRGIGVNTFINDHPDLLSDYKLFIELDRMGIDEFTHYNNFLDDELEFLLIGYNFSYNVGFYSDIKDLSDHYRIQSVNLSVGYYKQHSKAEYLDFKALEYVLIPRYNELINTLEGINESYYLPISEYENYPEQEYLDYSNSDYLSSYNTIDDQYIDYLDSLEDYDYNNLDYLSYQEFCDSIYKKELEYLESLDYNFENIPESDNRECIEKHLIESIGCSKNQYYNKYGGMNTNYNL